MLGLANKYVAEINDFLGDIVLNPKGYEYAFNNRLINMYKAQDSTWEGIDYVSLDKDGNFQGIIFYNLFQTGNRAEITIASKKKSTVFLYDVLRSLDKIFNEYSFNKVVFSVNIGNKTEKTYDKFIKKYGGHIVGTFKEHNINLFGKVCDTKFYELTKDNWNAKRDKSNLIKKGDKIFVRVIPRNKYGLLMSDWSWFSTIKITAIHHQKNGTVDVELEDGFCLWDIYNNEQNFARLDVLSNSTYFYYLSKDILMAECSEQFIKMKEFLVKLK